jgi:alpha-beta hydrolase superfamily lysophospholipase
VGSVWLAVLVVVAVFASIVAVAGWFASERLLRVDATTYPTMLTVEQVSADLVTLPLTPETRQPGRYGIEWGDGHAVLDGVVRTARRTVTRRLASFTDPPKVGTRVRWNVFVHRGTPLSAHGLEYEEITVPGELGPLPAWLLGGPRSTWVLLVHGFRATREEALRVLPVLVRLGYPVLVLSYRNDPEAPVSPDGYHHLGDSEWRDLRSAVRAALAHGASDVVLYGWSMGGCLIETFLHRSSDASKVRAVILDSPMLDWVKSIDAQVRRLHLPSAFTHVLTWFVARKTKLRFSALNHLHRAPDRTVATLLFHGTDDTLVPIATSDGFAAARRDLIVYHRTGGADHTQSWNVDPIAYENALRSFLADHAGGEAAADAAEANREAGQRPSDQ